MFLDLFLIPIIAAFLAMLFSHHCMRGEFPFRGLFVVVVGIVIFGAAFLVSVIYALLKAFLQ